MKSKLKVQFPPITIRSYDQLGNAIRRVRKFQNLSQIELAKKAGVTQTTISNLERGKTTAEVATLILILSALNSDMMIVPRPRGEDQDSLEGLF